jgi:hypothetical protein
MADPLVLLILSTLLGGLGSATIFILSRFESTLRDLSKRVRKLEIKTGIGGD